MPIFEFTSPEGKKHRVTGPEGSTSAQAFEVLQKQLAAGGQRRAVTSADIPGPIPVTGTQAIPGSVPMQQSYEPDKFALGDKIAGGIETVLTVGTGLTGGAIGMLGGTIGGLAASVMNGDYGTAEGVSRVSQSAAEGMEKLTYAPIFKEGQENVEAVGKGMHAALPVLAMTSEMNAMAQGLGTVTRMGADATAAGMQRSAAGLQRLKQTSASVAERVERTLRRTPDRATPTPGTRGSAGSAGTDMANQRIATAQGMPRPVPLTEGQATRSPEQLRFEIETSKGAKGEALRERAAEQNALIPQNFDDWVDVTGAELVMDANALGKSVFEAAKMKAKRDKAEVRMGYKEAERAGEMEQAVDLGSLIEHLNEAAPDAVTAPLLTTARARALKLGIAAENAAGELVPLPTTLKNAERMRQSIGMATDYAPTNMRQSAIIKGLIDAETDGLGGGLYRAARRKRENYAKQYEDRQIIFSLLNNKRGMADRQVAFADVFEHLIIKGTRDDVAHVFRVLESHPSGTPAEIVAAGTQAANELRGATVNWLKEAGLKNSATDMRGNTIFSASGLDKAVRLLDKDKRLNRILGKRGAQQMRDVNDLAKVLFTAPPGVVNHSNTASVLGALIESGATGAATGLPLPIASATRFLMQHVKDKKLKARIEQSLNGPQQRYNQQPPAAP
ncbi:MAG: hypothetical protein V4857_14245 [Pseudomonadota bacterium]